MFPKFQTIHNALINTGSWIFSTILGFIFLPYIVQKLGVEAYGTLVLVLSVIGYFAVLDLNLGDAVIKYVAEYHAENRLDKINEVVASVIFIFLILGGVGGLAIFLLSHLIITEFLRISVQLQPLAQAAFSIGSLGIVFTMLLSALTAIPNGVNRYDITSKMTMVMGVVTNLLTVLLLYFGFGLQEIVALNVCITLSGIVFYCTISKNLIPGLHLKPLCIPAAIGKVLRFGLFSSLGRLASIIQFQGVRLLAGALLGVSAVTFYVVPFTLLSKAMAVTSRLGMVIFPVVSGLQGKKDLTSIRTLYLKASRLILTMSTAICLPLILFGDKFMALWMGEAFLKNCDGVMLLLTVSLYLDSFTNVPSIVVYGLGRPKITGLFALSNAVLNLLLLYPLSTKLGINGIALSFLASQLCVMPLFVYYINNKVLGFTLSKLLYKSFFLPTLSGLLTAFPLLYLRNIKSFSMVTIVITMMSTTVLYLLISYILGVFSKDEKEHFGAYLRSIGKKTPSISSGGRES